MRLAQATLVLTAIMASTGSTALYGQAASERQWSDASGRFKVQATLIEVRDGTAFLKTSDGKTLKVPVDRLSAADQEFLNAESNPFEVVMEPAAAAAAASVGAPPAAAATISPPATNPAAINPPATSSAAISSSVLPWSEPWQVDWEQVSLLERGFDPQWNYDPSSAEMKLPYECKLANLPGKSNFFEGLRRLQFNPLVQRAVAGYTVSFSVPKPLSRISLIDLPSGKVINSEAVECDMCPLAILSDGQTVIMQGTGKEREGRETGDQLQLWRVQGKQVARSQMWIPFANDGESFGKTVNAKVSSATVLADNKLVLLADNGHLACFDASSRQPVWHARLSRNHAVEFTTDRRRMFVMDEHTLLVVDPASGQTISSLVMEDKPHLGWPRIRLSPSGDKLLMTFMSQVRLVDLRAGAFEAQLEFASQGPLAPNGLSYPADEYALLDNHLLLHIPTQIMVCDYTDAAVIASLGGTEFVALLGDRGGLVVPTTIPHPKAEEILKQAQQDPSVFLIHPGVEVALNLDGVSGEHRGQVEASLRKAANQAGYRVVAAAPISLEASISGPEQEAVSYIARGSYIATKYTTTVQLSSNGKKVWSRSGNNVPGVLQTKPGQSIQEKLDELGKSPDLSFYERVGLPKLLQAPSEQTSGNQHNALLVSKFTLQGLVDSR